MSGSGSGVESLLWTRSGSGSGSGKSGSGSGSGKSDLDPEWEWELEWKVREWELEWEWKVRSGTQPWIMYSSTPVVVNLERTLLVLLMYLSLRTFPWQFYFILIIVICGLTPTLFYYCSDLGSISISYYF